MNMTASDAELRVEKMSAWSGKSVVFSFCHLKNAMLMKEGTLLS
jgi:hypothetical protein